MHSISMNEENLLSSSVIHNKKDGLRHPFHILSDEINAVLHADNNETVDAISISIRRKLPMLRTTVKERRNLTTQEEKEKATGMS